MSDTGRGKILTALDKVRVDIDQVTYTLRATQPSIDSPTGDTIDVEVVAAPAATCPMCGASEIQWSQIAGTPGVYESICSCTVCGHTSTYDEDGEIVSIEA